MSEKKIAPFSLDFNLITGMCDSGKAKPTRRFVSNMVKQFNDTAAAEEIVKNGDQPIYDFYELDQIPETGGDLKFGTSIVFPGKVGDEYFMTKGHFHTLLDTGEVYFCLSGQGASFHQHRQGKAGHVLRLPRRRGPRLWHHRAEGLPQVGGRARRQADDDRQPPLGRLR